MPSKTLVIVDMQPIFKASRNPDTIIAVTNEIITARKNNDAVMFVEYRGSGRTHTGFNSLIRGYEHKATIRKQKDDGSQEIINALRRRNFPTQTLRICGVNTDCCVWSTVWGLLNRMSYTKIEVVKNGCHCEDIYFDWRSFLKHPNLRLV